MKKNVIREIKTPIVWFLFYFRHFRLLHRLTWVSWINSCLTVVFFPFYLEPLQWAESIFELALTIVLYEKVTLKDTFPSKSVVKVGFRCLSGPLTQWSMNEGWMRRISGYLIIFNPDWIANPWPLYLGPVILSSLHPSSRLMDPSLNRLPVFQSLNCGWMLA